MGSEHKTLVLVGSIDNNNEVSMPMQHTFANLVLQPQPWQHGYT